MMWNYIVVEIHVSIDGLLHTVIIMSKSKIIQIPLNWFIIKIIVAQYITLYDCQR